jgi:hypothetical protein
MNWLRIALELFRITAQFLITGARNNQKSHWQLICQPLFHFGIMDCRSHKFTVTTIKRNPYI